MSNVMGVQVGAVFPQVEIGAVPFGPTCRASRTSDSTTSCF